MKVSATGTNWMRHQPLKLIERSSEMRRHLLGKALILFLAAIGMPLAVGSGDLVTGAQRQATFERGDQVLFQTDFHDCPVGEIPEGFDDLSGSLECVRYRDHIWVSPLGQGSARLAKRIEMGKEDFSLEFRVVPRAYHDVNLILELYTEDPLERGSRPVHSLVLALQPMGCRVDFQGKGELAKLKNCRDQVHHLALQARRHQLRIFVDGRRVAVFPLTLQKPLVGLAIRRWGLDPKPHDFLLSDLVIAKYSRQEARPSPEKLGIQVERLANGTRLTIPERVLFDFDSFILKPEAREALDVVKAVIQERPVRKIEVIGHTDNVGGEAYNLRLSLQRAQSVADYLMYCGKLDPGLFRIQGRGEADPIADNRTEAGRAKNRRVELELLE